MKESIWRKQTKIAPRESLHGDMTADVAVIGAGMAGILIGYFLQQRGLNVVVLENSRSGGGQTQNTTAKITSQHNLIYHDLIETFGMDKARQYAEANQEAIAQYKQLVAQYKIDCNFEEKPAYVYTLKNPQKIEDEVLAAQKLGIPAEYTTETGLPFSVQSAVRFAGQAQFAPLKFLARIAEELTIYENTTVIGIEGHCAITPSGKVTAKSIVVAAHYPFINMPGFYFLKMYQQRSYVLALKNAADVRGMYIDEDENGFSFRNYNDLLLLGGAGHRCGENSAGQNYDILREAAARFYPNSGEYGCWSAQDCMTLDKVPYIGYFCLTTPHVYAATGFQKWGMTTSMVAAQIITGLITEKHSPYADVFSPQRFNLSASAKHLAENTVQAAKGLSRQFLTLPDTVLADLPNAHGGIVNYNGEKAGVYKDEAGRAYIVSSRCPHLGCQLEWNPAELSWDCPCHGSRFDYHGNLINSPAMEDLQKQ